MTAHLGILLPPPLAERGTSYTCGRVAQGAASPALKITIVTPRSRSRGVAPAEIIQVLPNWASRLPYPWVRAGIRARLEARFLTVLRQLPKGERAAYIWADASLATLETLRREGIPIFREMINGPRGAAKPILDAAYRAFGAEAAHGISDESVVEEDAALGLADFVFCSNAEAEKAVAQRGVAPSRILPASYGWDPARFSGTTRSLAPAPGLTAVFAGTISVRKGAHLLLEYWARSKVRGRLVLAGAMEPAVRAHCASLLARDDVVVLDYVDDIGAVYRSADLFVFPTLEEGGPQVTYEAAGCGLPAITTPMGAGRIIQHDREGFVIDPFDGDGWCQSLKAMAEDPARRRTMAKAAEARAQDFHWDKVAVRRRVQFLECLAPPPRVPADGPLSQRIPELL